MKVKIINMICLDFQTEFSQQVYERPSRFQLNSNGSTDGKHAKVL